MSRKSIEKLDNSTHQLQKLLDELNDESGKCADNYLYFISDEDKPKKYNPPKMDDLRSIEISNKSKNQKASSKMSSKIWDKIRQYNLVLKKNHIIGKNERNYGKSNKSDSKFEFDPNEVLQFEAI